MASQEPVAKAGMSVEAFIDCINLRGPPRRISLVAFKVKKQRELYGRRANKWVQ